MKIGPERSWRYIRRYSFILRVTNMCNSTGQPKGGQHGAAVNDRLRRADAGGEVCGMVTGSRPLSQIVTCG